MQERKNFGPLTLFGLGYAPFSASLASLVAVGVYAGLRAWSHGDVFALAVLAVSGLVTIPLARANAGYLERDPKEAVIDEFAGMLICLLVGGSAGPFALFTGFVLFRALDLAKPGFIGWLDRNVHGPYGFLVDDAVAGAVAGIFVRALTLAIHLG